MARRARVEYPGAMYHVITRGNQRQRVFRDDQDRRNYLEILANLKKQFSFRISAYEINGVSLCLFVITGTPLHPELKISQLAKPDIGMAEQ